MWLRAELALARAVAPPPASLVRAPLAPVSSHHPRTNRLPAPPAPPPPPPHHDSGAAKRAIEDDDDDDDGEEEGAAVAGRNLIKLWNIEARAAKTGKAKGGRRPKSGRQVIESAAAAILAAAAPLPNPSAARLGLGPCLLGKGTGKKGEAGRPRKQLTGAVEPGGAMKQFVAMEYHVTWTAANSRPPPSVPGQQFSHRCHEPRCVEPSHGCWEMEGPNKARDVCRVGTAGRPCPHVPVCLVAGV